MLGGGEPCATHRSDEPLQQVALVFFVNDMHIARTPRTAVWKWAASLALAISLGQQAQHHEPHLRVRGDSLPVVHTQRQGKHPCQECGQKTALLSAPPPPSASVMQKLGGQDVLSELRQKPTRHTPTTSPNTEAMHSPLAPEGQPGTIQHHERLLRPQTRS